MIIIPKLATFFIKRHLPKTATPEEAYNLWADSYDAQPHNLMLAWDDEIFSRLLAGMQLEDKTIADIGCGTGRHWQKVYERRPKKLIGFDISEGMLRSLKRKFPSAETHCIKSDHLQELENATVDLVFSTLTIAHISNAEVALGEWNRVLKPGGEMIITDYHPKALAKGGKRTFNHDGQTIEVKNYVHSLDKIKKIAKQLQLAVFRLVEKSIDESARPFYEKQNALPIYEAWLGTPIIYGIHLRKQDVAK